jgi:hypothetical protein
VSEPTRIEDIQERVSDLVQALRKAEASETAARIEGYAAGFTDPAQVRRAVASIAQQLEYFRAYPHELPDLPIVQIAAGRLEDVCKEALRSGVISAARLSARAQTKRKATIIVTTLAAGGLMFVVPLALMMLGVDITDVKRDRGTAVVQVMQGEEASVPVNVLVESEDPASTRGVTLYPRDHCETELGSGTTCKAVPEREWQEGPAETYEVKLADQAYGLLIAAADTQVTGRVGAGRVLIAATEDTPEGLYTIPLQGAFVGYTPERCNIIERLRGECTPKVVAADALHDGLPVETLRIEVVPGDPSRLASAQRKLELQAAEKQRNAAALAKQIENAVYEIDAVMDDTDALLRKRRYDAVRERIDKLTQLFAPLDELVVTGTNAEALPPEVTDQRRRFEAQSKALATFEDKAFDQAFVVLTAAKNKERSEDELLREVADKLRISAEYMDAIYAGHADELEKRMRAIDDEKSARERAAQAALEARCGQLPTGAWKAVETYLKTLAASARVKTKLGECMTPRLSQERCWTVVCDFKEIAPQGNDQLDKVTPHKWTFVLQNGKVVGDLADDIKR